MSDELAMRVLDEVRALRAEVRALAAGTADEMLTRAQAADVLGVSPTTFDRMRDRGAVPEPAIREGRVLRWSRANLLATKRGRRSG